MKFWKNIMGVVLLILVFGTILYFSSSNVVVYDGGNNVGCSVQDNNNYSHWCEYPCGNNIIDEAIKCSLEGKENIPISEGSSPK